MKRLKHGAFVGNSEKAEHYIWRTMLARCQRSNAKDYPRYGGRGIKVCPEWSKYEQFLADMGDRPSAEHSLDRKDTNGDYSPSNCKWSTRSEQQKNKTTTRTFTDGMFVGTLVECAAHLGLSKELAHWRFKNWNTFERGQTWQELQKQQ